MSLKLGIDDPEQWLEQCPQRVFDNWLAQYRLEPWGNESELLSKIIGLLFYQCCKQGGKFEEIEKFTEAVSRMVMPSNWVGQQKEAVHSQVTKEELRARFEAAQKAAEKGFG